MNLSRGDHYSGTGEGWQPPALCYHCRVNVSERLARFVAETEELPEEAIDQAKRAVLDTLGVTLAGSREESARTVADWVREQGGRADATVLGRGFRAPVADAALANGTAGHALDFDDVSLPMRGHPSVPLLPAAIAVAEQAGRSGRDYVGPGQEKHLPHEGWHAVQQMQGRVSPTMQTKGVSINNDAGSIQKALVLRRQLKTDIVLAVHLPSLPSSSPSPTRAAVHARANVATAVCRRLLTVPRGISRASAIWL